MSTLATRMRQSAKTLIDKYGKSVKYLAIASGTYDTATGKSTETKTETAIKSVVEEFKVLDRDGTNVQAGDIKLTISAKDVTAPKLADRVSVDATEYAIVDIRTEYCQSDPVVFYLQGRKT